MDALTLVDDWPVDTVAVAVLGLRDGLGGQHGDGQHDEGGAAVLGTRGPADRVVPLASVTKPLAAYAVLVAAEEEAVSLDEPAGPEGATVRHLLAHASGLAFDERKAVAAPGTRRLYSNSGFEVLGETVEAATGIAFADYLGEAVLAPLGMTATRLDGSPAKDGRASLDDLTRFAAELLAPRLLSRSTVDEATSVQFPGLAGVLPGFGRRTPNDWGLGMEIRAEKEPHWTATKNSPRTFGHFGQSGTFLWVDPEAGLACVCLTDRDFGDWAIELWPTFSDAVLAEAAGR